MPPITILRDDSRPYIHCPSCQSKLELPPLDGTRWKAQSPQDVADRLVFELADTETEELRSLVLNTKNVVIRVVTVARGSVNSAHVRIGELFRDAIRLNASGVILVHTHPSGDPTPSPDDLHLTAEALAAGRLLDIDLLDHIVVAAGGSWVSLRERGVVFDRTPPSLR